MDYFWLGFSIGTFLQILIYYVLGEKLVQASYDKAVKDGIQQFYKEFSSELTKRGVRTLIVKDGGEEEQKG